jgi:hypothetical protein
VSLAAGGLGRDHPNTALSLNNLASALRDLKDLAGVRPR